MWVTWNSSRSWKWGSLLRQNQKSTGTQEIKEAPSGKSSSWKSKNAVEDMWGHSRLIKVLWKTRQVKESPWVERGHKQGVLPSIQEGQCEGASRSPAQPRERPEDGRGAVVTALRSGDRPGQDTPLPQALSPMSMLTGQCLVTDLASQKSLFYASKDILLL